MISTVPTSSTPEIQECYCLVDTSLVMYIQSLYPPPPPVALMTTRGYQLEMSITSCQTEDRRWYGDGWYDVITIVVERCENVCVDGTTDHDILLIIAASASLDVVLIIVASLHCVAFYD